MWTEAILNREDLDWLLSQLLPLTIDLGSSGDHVELRAPSLVQQTVIGAHIFYRRPGGSGLAEAFAQAPSAEEPEAAPPPVRYGGGAMRQLRPRVQQAMVEVPIVERRYVERPIVLGATRSQAAASRSSSRASSSTARPAPRGPRVTIEGGVRVIRGS